MDFKISDLGENLDFIKGNMLILVISKSLRMFSMFLTLPFYPFYVLALGGSYFSIGLISAVAGAFSILPILVGGYWADVKSRKQLVGVLTSLMGPFYLINAFAPSWIYLLIGASIRSVFYGLRAPALSALMADSLHPKNRGKGYGIWSGFPMILAVIAPATASWMVLQMGVVKTLQICYFIGAIAVTIGGIIQLLFLKEIVKEKSGDKSLRANFQSLFHISKSMPSSLKAVLLLNTFAVLGWGIKKRYRATYAVEVIGVTAPEWGIIYSLTRGLRIILVPFFGHFVDKIGRKKMLLISLFIIPLMNLVFVFSSSFLLAFLSYTSYYTARHVRRTGIRSLKADLSKKEERGKINSLFRVLSRPINRFGVLIGGFLYGTLGKNLPFLVEAGLFIVLAVFTLFFIKEPKLKRL